MSRASVRGRLKLGKWDLRVLLEVLVFSEEYKPFQVAKRMVLTKYGCWGPARTRYSQHSSTTYGGYKG